MSLTLLLRCKSLVATREFYRDALGFEVCASPGHTETVSLNGSSLIFTQSDLWNGAGCGSFTVYIAVPDIGSYFEAVKDKLEIAWPLQETSYGSREFGVKDCNGYLIAFQAQAHAQAQAQAQAQARPIDTMRRVNKSLVVDDCNLAGSRFSDVNLENASFHDINLRLSRFRDVNLSGANFTDVDLSNSSIADCRIRGLTINGVLVSDLLRAYEK